MIALLPFPSVLDMMARDPGWTEQLGNAVLTQRPEVMDAVQRMRKKAKDYGYLQPNGYLNVVANNGYIEILPVDPGLYYVPYYDPLVVFTRPAHGAAIGGAIRFGPGITIGAAFAPWGWASLLLSGLRIPSSSTGSPGTATGRTVPFMSTRIEHGGSMPRGRGSSTTNSGGDREDMRR